MIYIKINNIYIYIYYYIYILTKLIKFILKKFTNFCFLLKSIKDKIINISVGFITSLFVLVIYIASYK